MQPKIEVQAMNYEYTKIINRLKALKCKIFLAQILNLLLL